MTLQTGDKMRNVPEVLTFEGLGPCYHEQLGLGFPRAGEFYLSGAEVQAWRAPNDLHAEFFRVRPTYKAIPTSGYRTGEEIKPKSAGPLPVQVQISVPVEDTLVYTLDVGTEIPADIVAAGEESIMEWWSYHGHEFAGAEKVYYGDSGYPTEVEFIHGKESADA